MEKKATQALRVFRVLKVKLVPKVLKVFRVQSALKVTRVLMAQFLLKN